MLLTPGRKFSDGPRIRLSGVRVANVGGKKGDEPFGRVGRGGKERGERTGAGYGELCFVFHGCPLLANSV